MFLQLLLAGLDVGHGCTGLATVPLELQILGLVGFATGMGLTTWAIMVKLRCAGSTLAAISLGTTCQSTSRAPVDAVHATTVMPIARFQAPLHIPSRSPGASFAPTIMVGGKIKSP